MPVVEEKIEYELGKVFSQIEISFEDLVNHLTEPGVIKLQKVLRYLENKLGWLIKHNVDFHNIEINVKDAELTVSSWGTIHIKYASSPITRIEIEISNKYDENEPVFITFQHYYGELVQRIVIGFYGKVELEAYEGDVTIRVSPNSKVYVLSDYYDIDYFSFLEHLLQYF